MKTKLFLVLVIVLGLLVGFSAVHTERLVERFKAEKIPSQAIVPVSPPILQYPKSYCQLALDDGIPAYYFDAWNVGDRNAIYFDPADCGGGGIYPFRLDTALALFYDFAGAGSVNVRVSVHRAIGGDPCKGPGEQLYLSPPVTVTTFYPNWVEIPIPYLICLQEPFFLDIQYTSGQVGLIPSLLMDSAPQDTCPLWVFWSPTGFWYNFNTFWEPPIPGEFFLRLIGQTEVTGCKYSHLYGDANCDGTVNSADIAYLINYLFVGGPTPCVPRLGDVNCDKSINSADIAYLINYLFVAGPKACVPLEILTVNATTPHLADSVDFSTVTINATDSLGNPVIGANIGVNLFTGEDSKFTYEATEKSEGDYTTFVPTTQAGWGTIVAIHFPTLVSAGTEVQFLPGEVAHLTVVNYEEPRDFLPRQTFEVVAVATDPFQNIVPPPSSTIKFQTDLGQVDSLVVDQFGDYKAYITSYELGRANVTVTEMHTMLQEIFPMVFPAVDLLLPPTGSYGPPDTLIIPVNVFLPDTLHDLGYYDFQIIYDPSMLGFLRAEDWDTEDLFPPPIVQMFPPDTIRVFQFGAGNYSTDIAKLVFQCLTSKDTSVIDVDLWGHSPFSLTDTYGNPIFTIPQWDFLKSLKLFEPVTTDKPVKNRVVKVWVAPGSFASQQAESTKMADDLATLQKIFDNEVEKCCPKFKFSLKVNHIDSAGWAGVDTNKDGELEEYDNQWPKPGGTDQQHPTGEEQNLLKNHHGGDTLNVYYVPSLSSHGNKNVNSGEVLQPGGSAAAGGVVVDPDLSTGTTLGHELGHLWGLDHKDSTGGTWGKENLMHPSKNAKKGTEKCKGLSAAQCSTITANDP